MHHTAILPLLSPLMLLGGLVTAVPVAEPCQSRIVCIDAVNQCGMKYGGCYDICDVSAKPVPPACPSTKTTATTKRIPTPTSTTKKVTTKKPHPTPTRKSTTTKPPKSTVTSTKKITTSITKLTRTSSSSCSATVSVCWDGINECGMWYGGCFPDCKPWPTFTPPPCPTTAKPPALTPPALLA
ncbi:uncharacterized protein B0T15DRAFT_19389 [Chaetomium strumarium]|uniref:Uncharacterized protein n=1 Tax=Chaetomium strumarium TaxID=1170767 RepID=A0AAJ0H188_9PEZI|nr:hypothetical protein B0T15DRAFT_19389 [Chaetomium strumarium]